MYNIPIYSKNPKYTGFPEFYSKAKGINIWIDNQRYLDMSCFLGTHLLGYSNNYINYHVVKTIKRSNTSLLNHKYMEKLSNLMLGIHQWADSVRFCNAGGEAMKLALDLAVEKSKGSSFLTVGYNGWQIKNINNELFTKIKNINKILEYKNSPNVIVFELIRHEYPKLETIKLLNKWQKQGTILVLDEITSGFRFHCGGAHLLWNIEPDICVFSKAIGNGYPISVIIGKEKYMKSDLWISSTNWTDGIGFVAGYHTIKMLKHCNYRLLAKLGSSMFSIWKAIAKKYSIGIKLGEVPQIANFEFDINFDNVMPTDNIDEIDFISDKMKKETLELKKDLKSYYNLACKSLFIQEMQKEGILGHIQFYPTFKHKWDHLEQYMKACDKVFNKIRKYLDGEKFEFKLLKEIDK